MPGGLIYTAGTTPAIRYAVKYLAAGGIPVVNHPTPDATHLLLDVPSFQADGSLRGGGAIAPILERLPENITVIGGNLSTEALREYRKIDLLTDSLYTARNAAITAGCAVQIAANRMDRLPTGLPTLVIGWGRIGKCLGKLLQNLGADLTILARKESDRAMLTALGYHAISSQQLEMRLPDFRLIYNTAPEVVITREMARKCSSCLKIDLASQPGILSEDTVAARGLPGICAPENSGMLIAETILNKMEETE